MEKGREIDLGALKVLSEEYTLRSEHRQLLSSQNLKVSHIRHVQRPWVRNNFGMFRENPGNYSG